MAAQVLMKIGLDMQRSARRSFSNAGYQASRARGKAGGEVPPVARPRQFGRNLTALAAQAS